MNDLSPSSLGPAQGTDVLATIRRLLAQDPVPPEDTAGDGGLRRRLIGTRRRGRVPARRPAGDVPPLDEADASAVQPQPLRLADDQRIAVPVAAAADAAMSALAEAPAEAAFSLATALAPDLSIEAVTPEVDPAPFPVPAMPGMLASPLSDARPFLHDVSAADGAASGAWPLGTRPASRLCELLTFQSWIAEPDSDSGAGVSASVAGPGQAAAEPGPQALAEPDRLAPAPASPEPAGQEPALLRGLIRDALLEELAGETGVQLGAAVRQLARDAIARALADLARGIAEPEAPGHPAGG